MHTILRERSHQPDTPRSRANTRKHQSHHHQGKSNQKAKANPYQVYLPCHELHTLQMHIRLQQDLHVAQKLKASHNNYNRRHNGQEEQAVGTLSTGLTGIVRGTTHNTVPRTEFNHRFIPSPARTKATGTLGQLRICTLNNIVATVPTAVDASTNRHQRQCRTIEFRTATEGNRHHH